jgi:hypothetical protein
VGTGGQRKEAADAIWRYDSAESVSPRHTHFEQADVFGAQNVFSIVVGTRPATDVGVGVDRM